MAGDRNGLSRVAKGEDWRSGRRDLLAAEQEARLWALRAATNLARLWDEQGRRLEAYDLLEPVFSWFTEGSDAPDLKEAATLLAELA